MTPETTSRMRRKVSVLVVAGVAVLAVLVTVFREMGVVGTWTLRRTQKQLQGENIRLRDEIVRLRGEVTRLKSNPSYIEEIARKELGLMGQKENVIVLDRKRDGHPAPPASSGAERP